MITAIQLKERISGELDSISDERLQKRIQFLSNLYSNVIDEYFNSLFISTDEKKD